MADTMPMLEHDPRRDYRISRGLRTLAFSFVAALVLVSLLIVVVRFLYDTYVAPALGREPYSSRVEFIVPAIIVITAILAKLLWDLAEGKEPKKKLRTR